MVWDFSWFSNWNSYVPGILSVPVGHSVCNKGIPSLMPQRREDTGEHRERKSQFSASEFQNPDLDMRQDGYEIVRSCKGKVFP